MSEISEPKNASAASREAALSALNARLASSAPRDINAELQERKNLEEKRALRRIIYSGIERNNDAKLALEAIKVLQKLARNIIDHPGEEKYMQFKSTNSTIQRTLINPKNTLEYAIAIGFRADIQGFQPFYKFKPTPKNMISLRNGIECLDEYIAREEQKQANSKTIKETIKEAQEKQKQLVKLAYEDDRKEKQMRDAMEKERLAALKANLPPPPSTSTTSPAAQPRQRRRHRARNEEGSDDDSDDSEEEGMPGQGVRLGPPPAYAPGEAPYSVLPVTGGDNPTATAAVAGESEHHTHEDGEGNDAMDEDEDASGSEDEDEPAHH